MIAHALSLFNKIQSTHSYFSDLVATSRLSNWVPKPAWFPFQGYSTTLRKTVYLGNGFFEANDLWKCSIILHEAAHLKQWRDLGSVKMTLKYATEKGRLNLELDGIRNQILWAIATKQILIGEHANYDVLVTSNRIIVMLLTSLTQGYSLSVQVKDLHDWAVKIVAEGYQLFR